jgi:DNA-binding response OmpR family regulator
MNDRENGETRAADGAKRPRSAVVLLIDDSVEARYMLRRHLERQGYTVWEAATGARGLELSRLGPDLVILDVHLPDYDGFEVCRRLRADPLTAALPIIQYSTVATDVPAQVQGMRTGADIYLADPEQQLILAAVGSVLRQRAAEADVRLLAAIGAAMDAAASLPEALRAVHGLLVPARAQVCVVDLDESLAEPSAGAAAPRVLPGPAVSMPLVARGGHLGYLRLDRGAGNPYGEADQLWLTAVAGRVALSVDNALLLERAQGEAARQRHIQEFASSLASTVTMAEVAFAVALRGSDAANAVFSNIAIRNSDGNLQLLHGPQLDGAIAARWTVVGGDDRVPLADAARGQSLVLLHDLREVAARYPGLREETIAAGAAATASVPLISASGSVLGAMGFAWASPRRAFSPELVATLETLASITCQALERAAMLEQERRTRDDLKVLEGLLRETSRVLTSRQILAAVTDATAGLPAVRSVTAAMLDPSDGHVIESVRRGSSAILDRVGAVNDFTETGPLMTAWRERREVVEPGEDQAEKGLAGDPPVAQRTGQATTTVVALPLMQENACSGALMAEIAVGQAPWSGRQLLPSIAGVAAQALDRARIYEHERRSVEVLQRSLLPRSLPAVRGLQLGAVYLPASEDDRVGGDWYDVIPVGRSAVVLVIGDVVGHGLASAALMGRLRHAIRAMASGRRQSPRSLIASVERILLGDEGEMATVLCFVLDIEARTGTWMSAGHLPPLIIKADGTGEYLAGGLRHPLGVGRRSNRLLPMLPAGTVSLEPGDAVVLYTDGLVERRDEVIDVGLQRLKTLAAVIPDLPLGDLEQSIVAPMLPSSAGDDVALLVARLVRE